ELFESNVNAAINFGIGAGAQPTDELMSQRPSIYLLGGATPYYLLPPVLWHTTWDRSPLGDVIDLHPDNPEAWAGTLYRELGLRYLLVDWGELNRLINNDEWYDPRVTVQDVRRLVTVGSSDQADEAEASAAQSTAELLNRAGGSSPTLRMVLRYTWTGPDLRPQVQLFEIVSTSE
ncbi:MAG: hypothetical protein ACOC0P_03305, partial [Planctomycetota bacterium]